MFNTGLSQAQTLTNIQVTLRTLRDAIKQVQDLYGWASGLQASDLVSLGFSSADATAILSAINDANALAQVYNTGLPPSSYPQPPSAYVYSSSQRQVIGPQ
jgi:hypothetical protein